MKDGSGAIVAVGYGSGEKRIIKAMKDALNSPLLNTREIENAQRLLYIIYSCNEKPVGITELREINEFMDTLPEDIEVLWGLYHDDTIGEQVKVAIVATGFDKAREQKQNAEEKSETIKRLWEMYYPDFHKPAEADQSDVQTREEEVDDIEDSVTEDAASDRGGRKQTWYKSLWEFVKTSLEEE